MSLRIQLASTPAELEEVFRLRHRVLVEEEGYLEPRGDLCISDPSDRLPDTVNALGLVHNRVVGCARFGELTRSGIGTVSLVCVERRHRGFPGLASGMMSLGISWAVGRRLTHLLTVTVPEATRFFQRHGFREIETFFPHPGHRPFSVPMLLDLRTAAFADPDNKEDHER